MAETIKTLKQDLEENTYSGNFYKDRFLKKSNMPLYYTIETISAWRVW